VRARELCVSGRFIPSGDPGTVRGRAVRRCWVDAAGPAVGRRRQPDCARGQRRSAQPGAGD
jgi:hypothetical protein